ncbi:hypothetical protein TSAR_003995 [Trichomalopsis sarcophagae]|uniref:Reverse transcriptase domain-containing protein n=1 Tax=Trichomalopsis sarcophagae TaxID=543379 RepID=A0A232EEW4_9HYME|nr:hypothetical protein TSAR_003995 [Trichomalopsis sarcophagae]
MSELKKPRRATLRVPGNRLEPGVVLSRLSHRHSDLLITYPKPRQRNFQLHWGLGRITVRVYHEMGDESSGRNRQQRAAWNLAAKVVTPEKVKWTIRNFQPFKAPGINGIYPAFLQEELEELVGPLVKLFRASVDLAYVPEIWKTAKVLFIPKAGKSSHTTVKDYRPISLNSFVQDTRKIGG